MPPNSDNIPVSIESLGLAPHILEFFKKTEKKALKIELKNKTSQPSKPKTAEDYAHQHQNWLLKKNSHLKGYQKIAAKTEKQVSALISFSEARSERSKHQLVLNKLEDATATLLENTRGGKVPIREAIRNPSVYAALINFNGALHFAQRIGPVEAIRQKASSTERARKLSEQIHSELKTSDVTPARKLKLWAAASLAKQAKQVGYLNSLTKNPSEVRQNNLVIERNIEDALRIFNTQEEVYNADGGSRIDRTAFKQRDRLLARGFTPYHYDEREYLLRWGLSAGQKRALDARFKNTLYYNIRSGIANIARAETNMFASLYVEEGPEIIFEEDECSPSDSRVFVRSRRNNHFSSGNQRLVVGGVYEPTYHTPSVERCRALEEKLAQKITELREGFYPEGAKNAGWLRTAVTNTSVANLESLFYINKIEINENGMIEAAKFGFSDEINDSTILGLETSFNKTITNVEEAKQEQPTTNHRIDNLNIVDSELAKKKLTFEQELASLPAYVAPLKPSDSTIAKDISLVRNLRRKILNMRFTGYITRIQKVKKRLTAAEELDLPSYRPSKIVVQPPKPATTNNTKRHPKNQPKQKSNKQLTTMKIINTPKQKENVTAPKTSRSLVNHSREVKKKEIYRRPYD